MLLGLDLHLNSDLCSLSPFIYWSSIFFFFNFFFSFFYLSCLHSLYFYAKSLDHVECDGAPNSKIGRQDSSQRDIHLKGFNGDWFGNFMIVYTGCVSIGWLVLLLVISLDYYGYVVSIARYYCIVWYRHSLYFSHFFFIGLVWKHALYIDLRIVSFKQQSLLCLVVFID